MTKQQIQTRAIQYIQSRMVLAQGEVDAGGDVGMAKDEIDTFWGWFDTFEDFKEWVLTESDWSREDCASITEIHAFVRRLMKV